MRDTDGFSVEEYSGAHTRERFLLAGLPALPEGYQPRHAAPAPEALPRALPGLLPEAESTTRTGGDLP